MLVSSTAAGEFNGFQREFNGFQRQLVLAKWAELAAFDGSACVFHFTSKITRMRCGEAAVAFIPRNLFTSMPLPPQLVHTVRSLESTWALHMANFVPRRAASVVTVVLLVSLLGDIPAEESQRHWHSRFESRTVVGACNLAPGNLARHHSRLKTLTLTGRLSPRICPCQRKAPPCLSGAGKTP